MRKLALTFVVGAAAGWFARSAADPPATIVREAAPPVAAARTAVPRTSPRRARAGAPEATDAAKVVAPAEPAAAEAPAPQAQSDDAGILAAVKSDDAETRLTAVNAAVERGLLSWAQLLERSRSDPDADVRCAALAGALQLASESESDLDVVSDEVLKWCRDDDPEKRSFGLSHLGSTGARGAAIGRELLDQGGLTLDLYDEAVQTLVAARQFERLAPEGLDGPSRRTLLDHLEGTVDADTSTAPQVADLLRTIEPPAVKEGLDVFLDLAMKVNATELVRGIVKSSAPVETRSAALAVLLDAPDQAIAAATLGGDILADPATPAAVRRQLLDGLGDMLAEQGEAGLAALRRVADHDQSPWIRERAAEILRDAEDR